MATVHTGVTFPLESYLWIQAAAEEVNLTVPAFIRFIIEDFRQSRTPKKHQLHKYATQEEVQAILDGMNKSEEERAANE